MWETVARVQIQTHKNTLHVFEDVLLEALREIPDEIFKLHTYKHSV